MALVHGVERGSDRSFGTAPDRVELVVTAEESPLERAQRAYTSQPLTFIPNAGQLDGDVRYYAQGAGYAVHLTSQGVALLAGGSAGDRETATHFALEFVGADPQVRIEGAGPSPQVVNHLVGRDRARWRTNLPTYTRIVYRDLWPGIDLAFHGRAGRLTYEFLVRPGGRPEEIRLVRRGAIDGAPTLSLAPPKPHGAGHPRLVQSGLEYSTYLGGSLNDLGTATAVDPLGNVYVIGWTRSADFPTASALDPTHGGPVDAFDAFVTKFAADGSGPIYSTFIGGTGDDLGNGIAFDDVGRVYLTGLTDSPDFPITSTAFDGSFSGNDDVFVLVLDAAGSAVVYSTYLGGTAFDTGSAIRVGSGGHACVVGGTDSPGFPVTPGAFDTTFNGVTDAFSVCFTTATFAMVYSTFLGGSGFDSATDVAVDDDGNVYLVGGAAAAFPTTAGAYDVSPNGSFDVFVAKLSSAGSYLLYSTLLGGSGSDSGDDIVVTPAGEAVLVGSTRSLDFPVTAGAHDVTRQGASDSYVTKLDATGASVVFSTLLGGSGEDFAHDIALDASKNVHVTGRTSSADYPLTPGAYDRTPNGGSDAVVGVLDETGSTLRYSTYLGGALDEIGSGIAVDGMGRTVLTGFTSSPDFPTTPAAFDPSHNGQTDAFVTWQDADLPTVLVVSPSASQNVVGTRHDLVASVTGTSSRPLPGFSVHFSVQGSTTASGSCTTDVDGRCDFAYPGPPLPGDDVIAVHAESDGDGMADPGEAQAAAAKNWILPPSTSGQVNGSGQIADGVGTGTIFFDVSAKSDAQGVKGGCNLVDPAAGIQLECLDATTLVQSGTAATFFGNALVNGSPTTYRIDVQDNGSPGKNRDTFRIVTASGYEAEGLLTAGNIRVRS